MKEKTQGRTNRKALVSFLLLFAFIVLPVSGIMLHLSDHGGNTHNRHLYMTLHNLAAFLFCIAAVIHGINNRKQIALYIRNYRKEITVSLLIAVLAMAAAGLHAFAI